MTTVFGIRSPWSGDENDPVPRSYWIWHRAYAITRRLRHQLGLHDYQRVPAIREHRCTWCGRWRA